MPSLRIFISHRTEDHHLADVIKQNIEFLSDGEVECSVSNAIPGGKEWHEWIKEQAVNSDLLLLLYTIADHDWDWCVREVSLFEGAKLAGGRKPRVTGFLGNELEPLAVIAQHQFYRATTAEVERFLRELLAKGIHTDGKAIVPELINRRGQDLRQARDAIASELQRIVQPEEYFHRRIIIRFPVDDSLIATSQEPGQSSGEAQIAQRLLGRAVIEGRDGSLGFLGLNRGASWTALSQSQKEYDTTEWLFDIERYVEDSLPGVDVQRRDGREQILTMIYRNGNHYLPVVARVEYSSGWPYSIVVIFVKMPQLSDNPHTMLRQGIPRSVVFLSILANLTRMFYWGVLETVARGLPMLENDPAPTASPYWVNFQRDVARARQTLDLMERQGRGITEIHTPAGAEEVSGLDATDLMTKLWSSYPSRKQELFAALDAGDLRRTRSVLGSWQRDVKDFMLQVHDRLRAQIGKLTPIDPGDNVRRLDDPAQEGTARTGGQPRMSVVGQDAA